MQIQRGRWSLLLLMPVFVSVCSAPSRGLIVFCAGDSITAQAYPHFLQRLLNREGIRARVLNRGQCGNTSGEYLSFLSKNRAALIADRPDVILLQLGTNDVRTDLDHTSTETFRSNMKEILALFRTFRSRTGRIPSVILATIPPVPVSGPFPFDIESARRVETEINPAIRELAAEADLALVDNHGLFVRRPDLLPDVHPSRDGYRALAASWLEAMRPKLR